MLILNLAIAALIAYIAYTIGWLNGDADGYAEAYKINEIQREINERQRKIIKILFELLEKEKANETVQDNL